MIPTAPRPSTAATDDSYDRRSREAHLPVRRRSWLGLGAGIALLACCGLKMLILTGAALSLGSAGAIAGNLAMIAAGIAVAAGVTAYAVGRRRRRYRSMAR